MELKSLIQHYVANSAQMMWFLGAGTSRSANMPTATDLIWDLKLKHYCSAQDEDIKAHDINNSAIKAKVQSYMDSCGYPALWSSEEYSFYFELVFGEDYQKQQQYLSSKLSNEHVSLNVGHRALAGLLGSGNAKIAFTTNFDEVIEKAYAQVNEDTIPTFHLEGSYGALEALNQESFPIYAKIHGDFKYQSIKNLAADLVSNDEKIMGSFLAAATRFGVVVTGYSGRDANVMQMFNKAIDQNNPFPAGLFWTVTNLSYVSNEVKSLIEKAQQKGINAQIVEVETFDTLLRSISKQTPNLPEQLSSKIKANRSTEVNIPTNETGTRLPILRTNLLPIIDVTANCAEISLSANLNTEEFYQILQEKRPQASLIKGENIHGFGNSGDFQTVFGDRLQSIETVQLDQVKSLISQNTLYHSLYERSIASALCNHPALRLVKSRRFTLVPKREMATDDIFRPIINALSNARFSARMITPKEGGVFWCEAIEICLESKNDELWLAIKPVIWVEPREERQNQSEAIKSALKFRWNPTANELLNAWIKVLFQNSPANSNVTVTAYADQEYPANFTINTRTAYSRS